MWFVYKRQISKSVTFQSILEINVIGYVLATVSYIRLLFARLKKIIAPSRFRTKSVLKKKKKKTLRNER